MYKKLLELSTPIIVINLACNYIAWTRFDKVDDIQKIFRRMIFSNMSLAGLIFFVGAADVSQNSPSWTERASRLSNIFIHAIAIGLSGTALTHWYYNQLKFSSVY